MDSELPMMTDLEIAAIEERRMYALKDKKRVYEDHVFDPDTRELFYLLDRVLADNETLLNAVKTQNRFIILNFRP